MPSCWVSPTSTREKETYGTVLERFASSACASSLLPSFPKAFCVGSPPPPQMESLFQLCNYCSSDFTVVSLPLMCAGLSLKTWKLNRYFYFLLCHGYWLRYSRVWFVFTENRSVRQLCLVIHACWFQREGFSQSCYWMLLDHHVSCWYNKPALSAFIIIYYKNHITRYAFSQNWRDRWQNRRSVWCAGRP